MKRSSRNSLVSARLKQRRPNVVAKHRRRALQRATSTFHQSPIFVHKCVAILLINIYSRFAKEQRRIADATACTFTEFSTPSEHFCSNTKTNYYDVFTFLK